MKVKNMPAGPEMDRLVAEKVMGWTHGQTGADYCGWQGAKSYPGERYNRKNDAHYGIWNPSKEIAHAWEVLERMDTMTLRKLPGGSYACAYLRDDILYHGLGDTAPLAICRAALISVGCEVVP